MPELGLISIAIAGLTTGGLTCFAVQGGLLTSTIARIRKDNPQAPINDMHLTAAFVAAKILSYTFLGLLLGLFGAFFTINPTVQAWIQILVAIYMVGIALQLLNVHPIFRYLTFQPPAQLHRWIKRFVKDSPHSGHIQQLTSLALLGFFTLLIPCGTTLAMQALAVSTGNPLSGALVMFVFTLSSSWPFFGLALTSSKLSQAFQPLFYRLTATVVIILALFSFNGGLNLLGSPYSFEALAANFHKSEPQVLGSDQQAINREQIQRVTIKVSSRGYQASTNQLQKGVPVLLTLETRNSYSCANAFAIPSLNIFQLLPSTGQETISFTPEQTGTLPYSCSMGMYRGNFTVI